MGASDDTTTGALRALDDALDRLDELLKNHEVGAALTLRGVNTSLAMTAAFGLRAYLNGDRASAIEDFGTVAEEISARGGHKA